MRQVILCTEDGSPTGLCEIWEAHEGEGKLHQAFSACVFRNNGTELLIQQRHDDKLFGGLWANTCCSHPRPESELIADGQKRLQEELGFTTALKPGPSFVYQAADPKGKGSEYEHDTILLGELSGDIDITPDPTEVADYRWVNVEELKQEMAIEPEQFAPWFHIAVEKLEL